MEDTTQWKFLPPLICHHKSHPLCCVRVCVLSCSWILIQVPWCVSSPAAGCVCVCWVATAAKCFFFFYSLWIKVSFTHRGESKTNHATLLISYCAVYTCHYLCRGGGFGFSLIPVVCAPVCEMSWDIQDSMERHRQMCGTVLCSQAKL